MFIKTRFGNVEIVYRDKIVKKSGGPNWKQWQIFRHWHFLVVWPAPHWVN